MSWLISNALIRNYTNSLCSQELEAESSAVKYSDGKQSEQLKKNLMQQAFCSQDKMTACSRLSRFGMMFSLLEKTIPNAQDLLNFYAQSVTDSLSAAVSHAKIYQPQEKVQELQEKGRGYGRNLRELLAKYDPLTHSLKTAQCSLLEDLMLFSVILPRWGTMRNGGCYQRQMLVHVTKESGCGYVPTPTKSDYKGGCVKGRSSEFKHWLKQNHGGTYPHPQRVEEMMMWAVGWTDLKPLATDKFHYAQQPLSDC